MDLYLEWNGDLVLTANGSVQFAVGWDEIRERIIRRILTNSASQLPDGSTTPPDYIFDPTYGLNGAAMVDQNPTQDFISRLKHRIRAGVLADAAIDPGTDPVINIDQPRPDIFRIFVSVTLIGGQTGQIAIQLG